ncbi:hypothetical protein HYH02_008381 [Chlamydomonas schloesseri]|uniref:Uncharacterized protein n=1 Tax=Chlamydomonas schloesseri TaxID=2026947 RepID=A0A835WGN9_9CHLO|nr:hypothetical protein HYH02_008381 [Chlamydomonas schloesseri]|eukprot:KAG2446821.1 hypothetical protein HYH02_008381 [Chlamydomonas schloesseri]
MSCTLPGLSAVEWAASQCVTQCNGKAGPPGELLDVTVDAAGALSGKGTAVGYSKQLTVSVSGTACTDAFTGLRVPFALVAPWASPASFVDGVSGIVVTPTTRLLAATAPADPSLAAAYALVGVSVPAGTLAPNAGPVSALKSAIAATRRTGVRMLFADAALTCLATAASVATTVACGTADAAAAAVFSSLAARAGSGAIDLFRGDLAAETVAAAAAACGKDAPAGAATDAAALYGKVVGELSLTADAARAAEFVSVPLVAAATAARVLALVQGRGTAATANWAIELEAASINRGAISAALGLSPALPAAPVSLRLNVRAAGPLTQCQVLFRDYTSSPASGTRTPTTDAAGVVSMPGVTVGLASVPGGCRDNALSTATRAFASKFAMRTLLPPGLETAALDAVSYLASAVFTMDQARSLKEESAPPRLISVEDYKKVYNALGVTDPLPAGTDFARQNWAADTAAGVTLISRAYLLNQKLQGALGPTCGFLAGLTRGKRSVDDVVAAFIDRLASDLIDGSLRLDDIKAYINGLMRAYLLNGASLPVAYPAAKFASASSGRRLLQTADPAADLLTFDLDQLGALLDSVATAVADSSSKLVQLEQQVAAAAAAGTRVNIADTLQQAAQVASVQQSSLSDALSTLAQEVAAAVAANDTAALSSKLQAATESIKADYAPDKLSALIQSAQVNTAAIKTVAEAGTAVDPPAGGGGGNGDSSGISGGAVAGAVIGAVVGAALIAVVALLVIKRRREHRTAPSSHNSQAINTSASGAVHFDPAAAGYGGAAAAAAGAGGVAGPSSARSVGPPPVSHADVDVEKGGAAGPSDPDRSPPAAGPSAGAQTWPPAGPTVIQSPSAGRLNAVHPMPIAESRSRSSSAGSAAASPRSPGARQGWGPAA